MPIYEFYCNHCNTIFNFYSRVVNTKKIPSCPACGRGLERIMSVFSTPSGKEGEEGGPEIDESRLERAMAELESEMGSVDEDDPKDAARLMRKLSEITGLNLGPGMEEALQRMEAGEDPERIEEEMGDLLEDEEALFERKEKGRGRRPPKKDETLYEL